MNIDGKAWRRSLFAGAFFATYIYLADRAINLKGAVNITVEVVFSMLAAMLAISLRRVPETSAYHLPFKWSGAIFSFFFVLAVIYGIVGGRPDAPNFLQELVQWPELPDGVAKALHGYIAWSAKNFGMAK
jgi:hypothetical protein